MPYSIDQVAQSPGHHQHTADVDHAGGAVSPGQQQRQHPQHQQRGQSDQYPNPTGEQAKGRPLIPAVLQNKHTLPAYRRLSGQKRGRQIFGQLIHAHQQGNSRHQTYPKYKPSLLPVSRRKKPLPEATAKSPAPLRIASPATALARFIFCGGTGRGIPPRPAKYHNPRQISNHCNGKRTDVRSEPVLPPLQRPEPLAAPLPHPAGEYCGKKRKPPPHPGPKEAARQPWEPLPVQRPAPPLSGRLRKPKQTALPASPVLRALSLPGNRLFLSRRGRSLRFVLFLLFRFRKKVDQGKMLPVNAEHPRLEIGHFFSIRRSSSSSFTMLRRAFSTIFCALILGRP